MVGFLVSFAMAAESGGEDRAVNKQAAIEAFRVENPGVRFYEHDQRIGRVYGPAFAFGESPEGSAEYFVLNHSEMFGVPAENLDPRGPLFDERHTQPVMFDRNTGDYKFTLVYYTQRVNDVPVFRSDLRLLVRNETDFPLVWANNSLHELGGFAAAPGASTDPALGKATVEAEYPHLTQYTEPELVIWAGYEDARTDQPALAFTFSGDNRNSPGAEAAAWLFVTDAGTGDILYREDLILNTDVVGNVSGMATVGDTSDLCGPEELTPMAHARVNIGSTIAFADANGDFVIPNGGNTEVTVTSPVRGRWFEVIDTQGNAILDQNVVPPGPANFVHNESNTSEFDRAEVNCYIHSNIIRDMVISHNPSYPALNTPANNPFDVNVNLGQNCNAFYDGSSINFFTAGGGCPNTGFSTVVHHEYGHHLVATGGSGQGQYGEGTGDVMGIVITDSPLLAIGWNAGNCNSFLRTADNNVQFPCSGPIHSCGRLISGSVWSTRNELIATEPDNYLEILQNLAVNAILMHSGSTITPQITIDYLTLDDDDDDIGNGTPHYFEIDAGFGAHNMPAPELLLLAFNYPNGRPTVSDPNNGADILVEIVPVIGELDPDEDPLLHVSIDGGPFDETALADLGDGLFSGALPAADCFSLIDWYISAVTTEEITVTDPSGAPGNTYSALVATGEGGNVVSYDFEVDPGFTVGGNASDGQWDRGVPVDCNRGDPPSDFDGSGKCWLTDNSSGGGCNSDVDGGSTTLTTNMLDMSDDSVAYTVTYARWYSNTFGNAPNADIFVVEISNNNGSTWTDLETVGPTGPEADGDWFVVTHNVNAVIEPTGQMRFRFTASDLGDGSVVEAGIDAFSVDTIECDAVDKTPPIIVHDDGAVTRPFTGYVDPKAESTNGVDVDLGIDTITIRFSEAVRAIGGGPLTPASFTVTGTGGGNPSVASVDDSANPVVVLTLTDHIVIQEWTTIIASVEDLAGNAIVSSGDQGPGVDETDRVDVAYLPTDVDQSGVVTPFDLLMFRQIVNDVVDPPQGSDEDFIDTDRNGDTTPFDLLVFRQLINGVGNATRPWSDESLNAPRP